MQPAGQRIAVRGFAGSRVRMSPKASSEPRTPEPRTRAQDSLPRQHRTASNSSATAVAPSRARRAGPARSVRARVAPAAAQTRCQVSAVADAVAKNHRGRRAGGKHEWQGDGEEAPDGTTLADDSSAGL